MRLSSTWKWSGRLFPPRIALFRSGNVQLALVVIAFREPSSGPCNSFNFFFLTRVFRLLRSLQLINIAKLFPFFFFSPTAPENRQAFIDKYLPWKQASPLLRKTSRKPARPAGHFFNFDVGHCWRACESVAGKLKLSWTRPAFRERNSQTVERLKRRFSSSFRSWIKRSCQRNFSLLSRVPLPSLRR